MNILGKPCDIQRRNSESPDRTADRRWKVSMSWRLVSCSTYCKNGGRKSPGSCSLFVPAERALPFRCRCSVKVPLRPNLFLSNELPKGRTSHIHIKGWPGRAVECTQPKQPLQKLPFRKGLPAGEYTARMSTFESPQETFTDETKASESKKNTDSQFRGPVLA